MSLQHLTESKYFKVAAITSGVLLVALVSFAGGMHVGFRKALFSSSFGANYEQNFLGFPDDRPPRPTSSMMDPVGEKGMRNPHGLSGEILSISGDTLVIKDRNNQESTVHVSDATIINRGKETLTLGDLMNGNKIVVIGKPQDTGVIDAHLIRVFQKDKSN
jgi:hypothetical protein